MTRELTLIADDDADLAASLADGLECAGFATVAVSSGSEALSVVTGVRVQLAIVDWHLGGPPEGAQLIASLVSMGTSCVVVMSADHRVRVDALLAGARQFVPKPFALEPVVTLVTDCFAAACCRVDEGAPQHMVKNRFGAR